MNPRLTHQLEDLNRRTLDQDARTAIVLRKIISHNLKKVLKSQFHGMDVQIIGETSLVEGATNAVTVQVESLLQFMFKIDIDTVPKEIAGYKIMEQVLPHYTLKLLAGDSSAGWLCLPYLASARNLHDIIKDKVLNDTDILALYADFLRQMLALWIKTYKSRPPDYEAQFVQRLQRRTKEAERLFSTSIAGQALSFTQLLRMPLRVNGCDYPPLTELFDLAVRLVTDHPAPYSVTAHRDEHAKNILVETAGIVAGSEWYLVDLPNVSTRADWVWSIAKMRHWWFAYYYIDQAKRHRLPLPQSPDVEVKFEIRERKVAIEYDLEDQIPSICRTLDQKVENLAKQMGKLLKDPKWLKRYWGSLFLVFYGSIPYHHNCQHVIPILVGESVKALLPVLEKTD